MVKAGNAERTFSKAAVRDYPLADPGQVETNIGVIAAMVSADGTPGGGLGNGRCRRVSSRETTSYLSRVCRFGPKVVSSSTRSK